MDFSGNSSGNVTASWHPEPTTRGSFTILSSCIITLTLCVWKAVHLNLPEHESCFPERKKTDLRFWMTRWVTLQKWRKVGWLILGILAPEMVAFTAWSQRQEAQELKDVMVQQLSRTQSDDIETGHSDQTQPSTEDATEMQHPDRTQPTTDDEAEMGHSNQAQPQTDDKPKMKNSMAYFGQHPWTTTHGFYAVMGGYAIDTSTLPEAQKFLPGSRDRLALTPDGLKFLAKEMPDLIPRVSRAEIQDKSKADTFAKAIITVQASFFIIQCLYRLIRHLPISLLELNTFAHTLCALLSYALWWEKPLEVSEPSVISIGESRELWAALCFRSKLCKGAIRDSRFLQLVTPEYPALNERGNFDAELSLCGGDTLDNLICYRSPKEVFGKKYKGQDHWIYTPRDRVRWSLVSSYVKVGLPMDTPVELPADTLSDRTANWPPGFFEGLGEEDMTDKTVIKLLVAFTLAGLSYGALHLLAWDFPFASRAEHLLWKISGLTVAASGPAFVCWKLMIFISDELSDLLNDTQEKVLGYSFIGISGAYFLLYIFARTYLIVESFISFVYLPDAAFQQPQWTYYFPHIG